MQTIGVGSGPFDGTARVTRNDAHANRRPRNWGYALGIVDFGTYPTNDNSYRYLSQAFTVSLHAVTGCTTTYADERKTRGDRNER